MKLKPLATAAEKGRARARARKDADHTDLSTEDPERGRVQELERARLISRIRLRPLQRTRLLGHRPEVTRIHGLQRTPGIIPGEARFRVHKDLTTMRTEDLLQKQDLRLFRRHWAGVQNRCLHRMHLQVNSRKIQMRLFKECTLISLSCTLERTGLQPDLTQSTQVGFRRIPDG